jgi:hypothetical protein
LGTFSFPSCFGLTQSFTDNECWSIKLVTNFLGACLYKSDTLLQQTTLLDEHTEIYHTSLWWGP